MTRIPTQVEHEAHEAALHRAELQRIEAAPLHERQEARAEWLAAMQADPQLIRERVLWLIQGAYGKGSWDAARRILGASKRTNKVAQLCQLIAALEWKCPSTFAVLAWHGLTAEQKEALRAGVQSEIDEAVAALKAEASS